MTSEDKNKIIEALSLMNGMILSNELHTESSHRIFREAMIILRNEETK